jgi:hypothetical protein
MGSATVHDLGACNLSICGLLIQGGGGTGGFIKITAPTIHEHKDGVHGDAVSYRTGNRTATFELTLTSNAPANVDLTALVNDDLESVNGAGIGDFLLEDLNDGFTLRGKCRLDGFPEVSRTAEPADVVWKGRVFDAHMSYDGER